MLALQSGLDAFGVAAVDDLDRPQQPRVIQEVYQDALERQRLEAAPPQLSRVDFADQLRARVPARVAVVEPVHVLDQREGLAAEALGEEERAGVGAVRRDAPAL